MAADQNNFNEIIKNVFNEAREKGGLEYIYTLLRIDGLTQELDPLVRLKNCCESITDELPKEKLVEIYDLLSTEKSPLDLLANLLNCISEKPYHVAPFHHLYKRDGLQVIEPSLRQIINELLKIAKES